LLPSEQNVIRKDYRLQQRLKIVTLNQNNFNRHIISWFTDCSIPTVNNWMARVAQHDNLKDQKRSGRPLLYLEAVQLRTIAFYCQTAPLVGCNSWSLRWAETYLKKYPDTIGHSISRSTIQRFLDNHALRPHLHKYFLMITDADFFPKMEKIIDLYLNQPDFLFNFDERTAMQAIARLNPCLPVDINRLVYDEFDYTRHGTLDLLAFLNPKTGKVFGRCTSNHNTQTLIQVFNEHWNTLPSDAQINYIMDNLSTHFNDDFCKAVAEASKEKYFPLKTGQQRRQWLQDNNKRIVIHFLPFHGSWLNMIEIWFGILNQKCLKHQSFTSVEHLLQTVYDFIKTWNNDFAHPFSWTYTGAGLQEKVVSRFCKLLVMESKQIEIKFLTKQLLLVTKIAQQYKNQVANKYWNHLVNLVDQKQNFISSIINSSDVKQRQNQKATIALDEFSNIINEFRN
jgi:transposase